MSTLDRRQFLGASAGLLAASLAPAQSAAPRLKKGFMLATFPDRKLPLLEKFRLLKEAGFDGAEPAIAEPAEEVLKARDATGLAIASMSCGGSSRSENDENFSRSEKNIVSWRFSPPSRSFDGSAMISSITDSPRYCLKADLMNRFWRPSVA